MQTQDQPQTKPLTEKHLAWCQSHDWGRNAQLTPDGRIVNLREHYLKDGEWKDKCVHFDTFGAIRDWAGY